MTLSLIEAMRYKPCVAPATLPTPPRYPELATAATAVDPPVHSAINASRIFVCPSLTPLFYSSAFEMLTARQRLRYNQISAIAFTDLILFFEQSFSLALDVLLQDKVGFDDQLAGRIHAFREDEQRHCRMWRRLNDMSDMSFPIRDGTNDGGSGGSGSPFKIVRVGWPLRTILRLLARWPQSFPVVVLMMLTLEEHSIEISRRCAKRAADELEPHYAEAFRIHLIDEARHVQVDRELLRLLMEPLRLPLRCVNALLFRIFLRRLWLRPMGAAVLVIKRLVKEFPELRATRSELLRGLREAGGNIDYRRMMLSPATAPLTTALLRRYPSFCTPQLRRKICN